MENKKMFIKELKRLRYKVGLTQERLSAYAGISLPTIKRWEIGESIPTPNKFNRLIETLKLCEGITDMDIKHLKELYSIAKIKPIKDIHQLVKDKTQIFL